MESPENHSGTNDEPTSAERRFGPSVTHSPSVIVKLVGALLVVVGSFGLLGTPIVLMFSEGIPESWANNQLGYAGLWATISLACIVVGNGVFNGRGWARFLAIALFLVVGLAFESVLPLLIALAFALVLVFGWPRRADIQMPSSGET